MSANAKSISLLNVGDSLYDMHNWYRSSSLWVTERHEVSDHVQVRMPGGSRMIQDAVIGWGFTNFIYTNKMLVIVDENRTEGNICTVRAAYSYDDQFFGLMKITVYL